MAADGMGWTRRGGAQRVSIIPEDGLTASCSGEQALLGGLICNPKAFDALPPGFDSRHFVFPDHADIFEAAKAAAQTDASLVIKQVQIALPDLAGPDGYIRQLLDAIIGAREGDLRSLADALAELTDRRTLVELAESIKQAALEPLATRQPTSAIVARSANALEMLSAGQRHGRPATMIADAMMDAIMAGQEAAERGNGLSGLTCGFPSLDQRLGGLEDGSLYVLGARPSVGKTALGLQMALRAALSSTAAYCATPDRGLPSLFISLEMQARQVGRRAAALIAKVPLQVIKSGEFTRHQWMADRLFDARARLAELPLAIEDEPALTVANIALRAKAFRRRMGGLRLLVIDHLHIVGRTETAGKHGDAQAISEITGGLKRLAKELGIPILLLAQLNRAVEGREDKRPGLADLRGSGSIEQDADAVMFIYRADYYTATASNERRFGESDKAYEARITGQQSYITSNEGKAEILFEKVRDGERGTEHLKFDGKHVRFYEEGENRV